MIFSKKDLNDYIATDNNFLLPENQKERLIAHYVQYPTSMLKKYLYYLRKQEYYVNNAQGDRLKGIIGLYYERKKNKLGNKLGIEIGPNCFGKGLSIWHIGSIIINPATRIGDNCTLHGNNCIGNNGKDRAVPRIGNNVDIGYGAVIIGDIDIADNVTIGANSVINKSILIPGSVVVGVPGRIVT